MWACSGIFPSALRFISAGTGKSSTTRRALLALVTCLLLLACSTRPAGLTRRLPSGSEITILKSGKIYFAAEKAWALALTYQTSISLSDEPALRAQAGEVMSLVKADVDKAGLSFAAFTAQSAPTGIILKTSSGRNFVMRKDIAGNWNLL
jgi:hypothetical protein